MNRLLSPEALNSILPFPATTHHSSHHLSALTAPGSGRRRAVGMAESGQALFAPIHYERRYAYPLLVWLHDAGGNERELRRLMPHVSVRNYVGAAVRGVEVSPGTKAGHTWQQTPRACGEAAERVRRCIEVARERYNIHQDRVFIAGFGCGGTMALRLALANPEWFAGAASLSGPMPQGHCPLGRVNAARRLPLFLASCRDSHDYPPTRVSADLRLLYSAGFSLSLRQYPCPTELTTEMLSDMDRWLMEQVCPSAENASRS